MITKVIEYPQIIKDKRIKEQALKDALIKNYGKDEANSLYIDLIKQFVDDNFDFIGYFLALDNETKRLMEKKK